MYPTILYNKSNLLQLQLQWGENGVHKIEHDITFGNKFLVFRRRDISTCSNSSVGSVNCSESTRREKSTWVIAQVECTKRITADRRRKSAGPLPWIDRARDVRALANFAEIYKVSNFDRGDCDWFLDEFRAHLCLTRIWKEKEKRAFVNVLETFWIYKCE